MSLGHPFTMICAGATGTGKTEFTIKLLEHMASMIRPPIDEVIWAYAEWQDSYNRIKNVSFHEGIPSLQKSRLNRLLVIDDQMEHGGDVSSIFTRESHHKNISVIFIVQNLFYHHRDMRTISLNCHYLVIFKNPRDASSVGVLSRQMYPGASKFLIKVYEDATATPHSYLFIDLKQTMPDHLRLRAHIFPGEINYVYVRKGKRKSRMNITSIC